MSEIPWFKVDDGFHSHPKALAAGDAALGLWVRLGSWSSNHRTNGIVPANIARMLGKAAALKRLVDVGLLDVVDEGYALHDFLQYNPSRAEVDAEREKTAKRVAEHRARKNAERNGVTNGVGTGAPTRPDPTRPVLVVEREEEVQEVEVARNRTSAAERSDAGPSFTSELPSDEVHEVEVIGGIRIVRGLDLATVTAITKRLGMTA